MDLRSSFNRTQKCKDHPEEDYRNFCIDKNCNKPLCPECINSHNQQHRASNTEPNIKSLKFMQSASKEKLLKIKTNLDQLYDEIEYYGSN
jgi:B-box zinc finger